jgi:O-antigen/teichoic acid export membrane protein
MAYSGPRAGIRQRRGLLQTLHRGDEEMASSSPSSASIAGVMARNTASNLAGRFVILLANFLVTPYLLGKLGPTQYGLWILVGSIVAFGWLLDLGIAAAVTKFVAEHSARGDIEAVHRTVSTALWIYAGLGLAAVLLGVIGGLVIGVTLGLAPSERASLGWLTFLMALTIGITIAFSPATAVLRGLQRFDLANLAIVGTGIAMLLTSILALALGAGLLGMVAANTVVTLVGQVWTVWLVRRSAPSLRFDWRDPDRTVARRIAGFSGAVFAVQLASRLQFEVDGIVVAAVLSVGSVTPYALALRLSGLATIVAGQFTSVIQPVAAQLSAGDDRVRLRTLYIVSTRLTLAILLPLGVAVSALAGPILTVWVGSQYDDAAALVAILTAAAIIDTSLWPAGYILQGMNRHRPLALIALVSALANIGLSIVLARNLGLIGVALGTLIPTSLEACMFVTPLATRLLGVSPVMFVNQAILPAVWPCIPTALLLVLIDQMLDLTSPPALVVAGGLAVTLYFACYLAVAATSRERRLIIDFAARAWRWGRLRS